MTVELSDTWVRAATLYVAREPEGECYRTGCDATAIVALTFLAEHEEGAAAEDGCVFLCRTHMHGFMGHFLDYGEAVETGDE